MILILILLNGVIYAQAKNVYLLLGNSRSQFRHEGNTLKSGIVLGAGTGFNTGRVLCGTGFASLEVLYSQKRATAENKVWQMWSPDDRFVDYAVGDIDMFVGCLEVPLKAGYCVNFGKKWKLGLFYGASLSFPVHNNTKVRMKEVLFYDPDQIGRKVDYWPREDDRDSQPIYDFVIDNIGNTSFSLNFGAIISWSLLSFEFRYSYALSDTKNFTHLTLRDQVDAYFLLMGIRL